MPVQLDRELGRVPVKRLSAILNFSILVQVDRELGKLPFIWRPPALKSIICVQVDRELGKGQVIPRALILKFSILVQADRELGKGQVIVFLLGAEPACTSKFCIIVKSFKESLNVQDNLLARKDIPITRPPDTLSPYHK